MEGIELYELLSNWGMYKTTWNLLETLIAELSGSFWFRRHGAGLEHWQFSNLPGDGPSCILRPTEVNGPSDFLCRVSDMAPSLVCICGWSKLQLLYVVTFSTALTKFDGYPGKFSTWMEENWWKSLLHVFIYTVAQQIFMEHPVCQAWCWMLGIQHDRGTPTPCLWGACRPRRKHYSFLAVTEK